MTQRPTKIQSSVLSNELKQKEKLKKEYESQLKMIQKARSELVSLGNEGLGTFWDKIGFLKGYWVRASSDAEAIEIWLKKGASDAVSHYDLKLHAIINSLYRSGLII